MADWILNFTKGGAKVKKQMPQQARDLLLVGLWGIPPTAQAKDKLAADDRVLAYVGAPDRVFIGEATIEAPWHEWTSDEAARYPMTSSFAASPQPGRKGQTARSKKYKARGIYCPGLRKVTGWRVCRVAGLVKKDAV